MSFRKRYEHTPLCFCSDYLREVLEDDSGGFEGDLDVLGRVDDPLEDLLDVGGEHVELIAVSDG